MRLKRISSNVNLHGNPILAEISYAIIPPQTDRNSAKPPQIAEKGWRARWGLNPRPSAFLVPWKLRGPML